MVDFHEDLCPIIAKLSEGFSFAYLKELFVIALLVIARGGKTEEEEDQPQIEDTKSQASEPIMIEHGSVVETSQSADKATIGVAKDATEKPKETPKKRALPEVETPPHLQDNNLLKVVRAQLKLLLDEMDNTKEEDWPSEKTPSSGGMRRMAMFRPPPRVQLAVPN
jgi:hypothetical protein